MKFTELNLNPELLEAMSFMGLETAMPIQEQVIPIIIENKDLIACSQTGSGKTAAFVLPILNKLITKKERSTDTLIIAPTRELAIQIEQQIQGFSYFVSASSIAIYGGGDGKDWDTQKVALKSGTDIVIATPGKLLSHLKMGYVNFKHLQHFILDEADRMLDMGFIDDINAIISYLPKQHQTLMFSATMSKSIRHLAHKILHNPAEISLAISKPVDSIDQKVCLLYETQKLELIKYVLAERKDYDSIIIFTSTKKYISELVRFLNKNGFHAKGISSNLDQNAREEVLANFKSKKTRILVATDVMSRGIDVKEINMVINFDVPHDAEDYVHRIGRTARANAKGEAITLTTSMELYKLKKIEQLIGSEVPKMEVPKSIGDTPEWKEMKAKKQHKKRFYKKRK